MLLKLYFCSKQTRKHALYALARFLRSSSTCSWAFMPALLTPRLTHPYVLAADEHLWDLYRLAQSLLQLSVVVLLHVDVPVFDPDSHVVKKRKNVIAILERRPDATEAGAVNNDFVLLDILLQNQACTPCIGKKSEA